VNSSSERKGGRRFLGGLVGSCVVFYLFKILGCLILFENETFFLSKPQITKKSSNQKLRNSLGCLILHEF